MTKSVSVVIPVYNEGESIERAVGLILASLDGIVDDYELILVNDASRDASGEILDRISAGHPRVRVIHNDVNKKLGGTLRVGFAGCVKEIVLYTDADLPCDIEELRNSMRIMEITGADIVSAFRFDRTAEGFKRSFYSFVYNMMIRSLFGIRIRDVNFAFKLFRREILDRITLRSEGSFIDAELLIKSKKAGYGITQFGVNYFPRLRGESALWNFGNVSDILKEMFAYRFNTRKPG